MRRKGGSTLCQGYALSAEMKNKEGPQLTLHEMRRSAETGVFSLRLDERSFATKTGAIPSRSESFHNQDWRNCGLCHKKEKEGEGNFCQYWSLSKKERTLSTNVRLSLSQIGASFDIVELPQRRKRGESLCGHQSLSLEIGRARALG